MSGVEKIVKIGGFGRKGGRKGNSE